MATDWQEMEWGDLATLEYGKGLRGYEVASGPYRVYGTNGPIGWNTEALYGKPGVIIGRKGAYRGVHFSPKPFYVIDTAFYLKPKIEFDMKWAYYELLTHDINSMDSGSAIPSTSRDSFYSLPVMVPSISEQHAIAYILGTLDDKIELNRKMNQTFESMARAIFKSWFVDFDPVRAKAEGRDTALPSDLAALFPDSFQDSELGEIPKGWKDGAFADIVTLSRDSVNPSEFPSEQFNHFSIPAFDEGRVPKAELGVEIKSNKFLVPPDVVLLSKLNPRIPRVWLPNIQGEQRAICSTEFLVARPKTGMSREYLFLLFTSQVFTSAFATFVTGTSGSHQRVKPDALLDMQIIIPTQDLLIAFSNIVKPFIDQITQNIQQSDTVAALRDSLLPKLLSGEIRIKDTKRITDATVSKNEVSGEAARKSDKRKATDEFREAILISALVRALSNNDYPLGRKRYSKICYLIHRKLQHAVEQKYLKKAAGPYSPWTRYKGPESIAIKNGYIKQTQKGVLTGFGVGPQISEIDQYLQRYDFKDALDWAVKNFGKMTNDRLELLATVDFAVLELKSKGKQINSKAVRSLIEAEPEWVPKLNRNIFSELNIQSALRALRGYFADAYNGISSHPPDD